MTSQAPEPRRVVEDAGHEPCSLFEWCDGHDSTCPELDGSHMTTIKIGEYEGGEAKSVYVIRYVPTSEFDEPARWSFSMPTGDEWTFGRDDVDREIDEGVAELEAARRGIRAFLDAHDKDAGGVGA